MQTVRAIIEAEPLWVPDDMPVEQVAAALAERGLGGAPVCTRDGAVVGVISKTDLTEHYGRAEERLARDLMTPHVLTVRADAPLELAIRRMAVENVHQLVVVDERERFAGVVTSMDILRELAGCAVAVTR
ncbi:MAG: CBS domain-containing protein [Labilithrix sp.]|nr:CBS domain-containing protein [Labilithrix sp.]MCW5812568.1 CBS domain-containing protein [Labilithrix sp.]